MSDRLNVAGIVVGIVMALGGLAIQLLWPDKRWIGWICLGAAAAIFAVWLFYEARQFLGSGWASMFAFIALGAVLGGCAGFGLWYATSPSQTRAAEVESSASNSMAAQSPTERPSIAAYLVVDSIEEKERTGHSFLTIHFHITNGSVPPAVITIQHVNWDLAGTAVASANHAENVSNLPRDLPPNQGLDVNLPTMNVLDKNYYITINLHIYYQTDDKNSPSLFWTYGFVVRPRYIKPQDMISPSTSSGGKGEYDAQIYRQQSEDKFAGKKGRVALSAPEMENGKPTVKTLLENSQRRILFDANSRMVRFEMNLNSAWVLKASAPLREGRNGIHQIVAAWNGSDGLIFVDVPPDEFKASSKEIAHLFSKP